MSTCQQITEGCSSRTTESCTSATVLSRSLSAHSRMVAQRRVCNLLATIKQSAAWNGTENEARPSVELVVRRRCAGGRQCSITISMYFVRADSERPTIRSKPCVERLFRCSVCVCNGKAFDGADKPAQLWDTTTRERGIMCTTQYNMV